MGNVDKFNENQQKLKKAVEAIDFEKIKEKHKLLSEDLGNCFVSTSDIFEALEEEDCFCIGLDVGRSEACIADPSRLVIKKIIPCFVTADTFLDAAKFSLKNDTDAHGGFEQKI